MSEGYQPPVNVSPLIRGARWAMLITGIIYGSSKRKYYASVEKELEKERNEQKIINDALAAERKMKQAAIEEEALALLSPPKLPPPMSQPPPPQPVSEIKTKSTQPKLKTIMTPSKLSIIPPQPELKPLIPSSDLSEPTIESMPPQPEKLIDKKRKTKRYED